MFRRSQLRSGEGSPRQHIYVCGQDWWLLLCQGARKQPVNLRAVPLVQQGQGYEQVSCEGNFENRRECRTVPANPHKRTQLWPWQTRSIWLITPHSRWWNYAVWGTAETISHPQVSTRDCYWWCQWIRADVVGDRRNHPSPFIYLMIRSLSFIWIIEVTICRWLLNAQGAVLDRIAATLIWMFHGFTFPTWIGCQFWLGLGPYAYGFTKSKREPDMI